jgi:hypothetical protein
VNGVSGQALNANASLNAHPDARIRVIGSGPAYRRYRSTADMPSEFAATAANLDADVSIGPVACWTVHLCDQRRSRSTAIAASVSSE